jgi:hypothetical protein
MTPDPARAPRVPPDDDYAVPTEWPRQSEAELAAERAHIEDLIARGVVIPAKRPKGKLPRPLNIPNVRLSEIVIEDRG